MRTFKQFLEDHWDNMKPVTLPPIDSDRFPNRENQGLEGPFRFKNGQILYYDPKEGKYYDSLTDMYVDDPHRFSA